MEEKRKNKVTQKEKRKRKTQTRSERIKVVEQRKGRVDRPIEIIPSAAINLKSKYLSRVRRGFIVNLSNVALLLGEVAQRDR